jgi:AraC-like DNA-binding protein
MAYREFHTRTELADLVACTWERRVPPDGARRAARVVPDGCVDLVWREGELFLAGPDTRPFMSPLPPGATILGLRLRPGVAGSALGLPASELRDAHVPLEAVWGRFAAELAERLAGGSTADGRRVLEDALAARRSEMVDPDPLVQAAARRLGAPAARVRTLSRALGVSERHLRRRFHTAVGYGPKTLDRVLRFQRFLARAPALGRGDELLARLALELGYADQAHLSRECVRLSGLSPTGLVAARNG